jgi:anaerobic ribonucleoside-triphosphate reductase activating protein
MLYYTEFGVSHLEVPGENALCIYISGCANRCVECHYPELQKFQFGDLLCRYYKDILELYASQATCVCFLGEGRGKTEDQEELIQYAEYAHQKGLKACLYSGRDVEIEPWMHIFDYIKLGSYKKDLGPLSSPRTNQKMYARKDATYQDVTILFQAS